MYLCFDLMTEALAMHVKLTNCTEAASSHLEYSVAQEMRLLITYCLALTL